MAAMDCGFSNDGLDNALVDLVNTTEKSIIIQSVTEQVKRGHNDNDEDPSHLRKKNSFQSALLKQLSSIDPDKSLSIHEYLDDHDKDPIVKEYIDKLMKLRFYPCKPNIGELEKFDTVTVKCDLSASCHEQITELLMAFFHCRYNHNNLVDATANGCTVIPVQAKLTIPFFAKTPAKSLQKLTKLKTSLALQIQGVGVETTEFISELLYISAAYAIYEEIHKAITDENERIQEIQTQFEIHFLKSEMEYMKQAKIKNILWNNYRSKVKHIEPRWRALGLKPPTLINNHLATNIKNRINRNEENFDPKSVKIEFVSFLVEGEKMIERMKQKSQQITPVTASTSSSPPPPPPPSSQSTSTTSDYHMRGWNSHSQRGRYNKENRNRAPYQTSRRQNSNHSSDRENFHHKPNHVQHSFPRRGRGNNFRNSHQNPHKPNISRPSLTTPTFDDFTTSMSRIE